MLRRERQSVVDPIGVPIDRHRASNLARRIVARTRFRCRLPGATTHERFHLRGTLGLNARGDLTGDYCYGIDIVPKHNAERIPAGDTNALNGLFQVGVARHAESRAVYDVV